MSDNPTQIDATGEATGFIPALERLEPGFRFAPVCEVVRCWKHFAAVGNHESELNYALAHSLRPTS